MRRTRGTRRGLSTRSKIILGILALAIVFTILILGVMLTPNPKDERKAEETQTSEETTEQSEETLSTETAETEANDEAAAISKITVLFNSSVIKMYTSKEDALNHSINLSDISNGSQVPIQCAIGLDGNVKRVRVWTENDQGVSNGDEYILWKDNDWAATMDLSKYSGTIIIVISIADTAVIPNNTYEYFGINLPEIASEAGTETSTEEKSEVADESEVATEAETAETTAVEETAVATEATLEKDGVTNPQMFINTVAVTGYKTFEEAVANPVRIAASELSISASDVNSNISSISIQLGDIDKKIVDINCNPLTSEKNWKRTIDVSSYEGEILVLNISSEIGFASGKVNQFIAIKLK